MGAGLRLLCQSGSIPARGMVRDPESGGSPSPSLHTLSLPTVFLTSEGASGDQAGAPKPQTPHH